MAYVIAEPCVDVKDKACVDECPVDCIYEGDEIVLPNDRAIGRSRRATFVCNLFDADIELGDFEIIAYEPDDVLFLMQFLATG